MIHSWRKYGRTLLNCELALLSLAFVSATASAQSSYPTATGLPESNVVGVQAQVPTSGPTGPTYSTFTVASPATGPVSAAGSGSSNPNPYNAWCWNPYAPIQTAAETYTAYSSYDPNFLALPGASSSSVTPATGWQEINWVLNHKHGESGTLNPTVMDIQYVIWNLLIPGNSPSFLMTADGQQLQADALQYGPGFQPTAGQILAVVLYIGGINTNDGPTSVQDIFVEYTLPTTPQKPGISITKTANKTTAKCSDQVVYTYTVKNTGNVTLTNITVTDDNATPTITSDDITVCTIASLAPNASTTCSRTLYLPQTQVGVDNYGNSASHTLITSVLPNGNIQVTLLEDLNIVDNSYGVASSPDWGSQGNSPWNHLGQDSAEFQFVDGAGNVVLDFAADYASFSWAYPSGIGTAGVNGGAGRMYAGSSSNIVSIDTTITDNMNQNGNAGSWYTNSPPPGYKNWNFQCGYTVVIKPSCFGRYGYGGCNIKNIQHGQCKTGKPYQCNPSPICGNVTNTATATVTVNGQTISAKATSTVALVAGGQQSCTPPPSCQCSCWNCQHGDHAHCQYSNCHDSQCKQQGCPYQKPAPCKPQTWWKQCNQSFQQCGRSW